MTEAAEQWMGASRTLKELVVVLMFGIGCTLLMISVNAYERLYLFARAHTNLGFAEVAVFLPSFLAMGLVLFAYRQIEALREQIGLRQDAEEALRESESRYRELSITDGLTQLFNARHFGKVLAAELERAQRYELPVSLLVADIDDFKQYNDRYGHLEGNKVLVALAEIMGECIRESDSAYRHGGEEFALVLIGTSSKGATSVAERIRESLEARDFLPGDNEKACVTVSIGVAQYEHEESPDSLIERADRNMYEAKREGKNRVVFKDQE